MQPDELAILIAQARAGNSQAFIDLLCGAQRDLRVFIATFASSAAMLDSVFQATVGEARRQLNDCPTTPAFYTWLRQLAMRHLADQLDQTGRRAVAARDALAHIVIRAGLDALQSLAAPSNVAGQQVGARFGELDERGQGMINARYAEGRNCAAIAEAFGLSEVDVPTALFRIRAALDWRASTPDDAEPDRLFPTLVEDHLTGAMAPDARELLSADLMKDLARSARFAAQVRLDLVLTALLGPALREQVQEAVRKLGSGHESSRLMMGPPPVTRATPASGVMRAATPATRLAAAKESGVRRAATPARVTRRPSTGLRNRSGSHAPQLEDESDEPLAAPPSRTPMMIAGGVVLVGIIALAIVWGRSGSASAAAPAATGASVSDPASAPALAPAAASPTDAVARVIRSAGHASLIIDGKPKDAVDDASLPGGSGVETSGSDASVVLALLDNPVRMTVTGDGRIGSIARTRIQLQSGMLDLQGTNRASGATLEVATAQARITAEPGHCQIRCGAAQTRVEVSEGAATVARADGKGGLAVRAGQAAVISSGGEPLLEIGSVFVRGINFGGTTVTIDGNLWLSQRDALGGGLTLAPGTEAVPPTSITAAGLDFDSKSMLDTGLAAAVGPVHFIQVLPNGTFDVMLWIASPEGLSGEGLAVALQGQQTPLGEPRQRSDSWRSIGPYRTVIANHRLDVVVNGLRKAHLAGAAFFSIGKIDGAAPVVIALDNPQEGARVIGDLPIIASIAGGTTVAKVEFYNGETKLGETTVAPYRFLWASPPPGPFAVHAVALDGAGQASQSAAVSGSVLDTSGTGVVKRETWNGIGGVHISDLLGNPAFPDHPTSVQLETGFLGFPENQIPDVGTRMSGYLHPPADGDYVFWVAGDDNSQLFLSTGRDPARKRMIAQVENYTNFQDWEATPAQRSEPIPLRASQVYYVEVLQKQGGGGSHVSVGWKLPDGAMERPIPASRLSVVPGPGADPTTPAPTPAAASPAAPAPVAAKQERSGPFLESSLATPDKLVDLTAEGTSDWVHWGLANEKSIDRRDGAALIGDLRVLGGKDRQRYDNNLSGFSWAGGTPNATAAGSRTGLFVAGIGAGFQCTAPADPSPRRLRIYLGGWKARASFAASLSDGSAPPVLDKSQGDLNGNFWTVFELNYRAKTALQTLTVTFTQTETNVDGNINFQAMSLAYVGAPVEAFVKGIDFSGDDVVIDGNKWLGQRQAEEAKEGLVIKNARKVTGFVEPKPAVDAHVKAMLTGGIAASGKDPLTVVQRLPNGEYDVYVWVMETVVANSRSFDLAIGDETLTGIGELPINGWAKYGPLRAVVKNGSLELVAKPHKGTPQLMGMAIFTAGAPPAGTGK